MKISYNWLKEFVEFDKTPEQLADDLSLFGHAVESVEKVGDDFVLDFEITPNRGDCLSITGMAREIAALYRLKFNKKDFAVKEEDLNKSIYVSTADSNFCPRYSARIIDNVEVKESPKWLQEKLATYGFRPINNIVDITNYVMVATGQPLHAFDYDKIKGGIIKIRYSIKGEDMITLDGQVRKLPDNTAVITDNEKIYDLAGIMGGFKSEVDEKTKTIVLQGAIFDQVIIRKASKGLNHSTDASYRYERGVDFEGTIYAIQMASSLILEDCSKAKAGKMVDEIFQTIKSTEIEYQSGKINHLLGTNLSEQEIKDSLERLNFKIKGSTAKVPPYRYYDTKIWQDLAEEIARIYGYNNIEKRYFGKEETSVNKEFIFREAVKDFLINIDFTEVYSYSFSDSKLMELLGLKTDEVIQIKNPLSPETKYLRPNLIVSVLSQIAKNPWSPETDVFEIEKVFHKEKEWWQLCLAITGKNEYRIEKAIKELKLDTKIIQVDQKILDYLKIRRPVKYILVNLEDILNNEWKYKNKISENKYKNISKYPPTVRDLSLIFESNTKEDEIIESIKSVSDKILITELFDTYHIDNNQKSLAFHIWLQDMQGPMNDEETKEIINKIIKVIEDEYKAKLRTKE